MEQRTPGRSLLEEGLTIETIQKKERVVDRAELTDLIAKARVCKGLTWSEVAPAVSDR
jgi:hypothetical protein